MTNQPIARRAFIAAVAGSAALGKDGLAQLAPPKSPVTLNVVDAAGNLAMTQPIFENFRRERPDLITRFTFTRATQLELPAKLKAQQDAGRVDIDLVLGGYDTVTIGIAADIWQPLLPNHATALPKLDEIYLPGARRIQEQCRGMGVVSTYSPYGMVIEYHADRVKKAPTTADELMAWCRENKNRFFYGRPANSGPGRAFMVGLPYILGDTNPRDPVKGWDRTWAYLRAIGEHIEYYPSGTAAMYKEFGEGSRDMIPSTMGWDINPRAIGTVPKEAKVATLQGFHWVSDAHCWCVPKGVTADKLAVILALTSFMLTPRQQAIAYDKGYMYPGPSVKGVSLDMAPEESQAIIREFGRPEYATLIETIPQELPLEPEAAVAANRIWDEQVGAAKRK